MFFMLFVFFFKQKTAYEMRISDWSSDVCSSDLLGARLCVDRFAINKRFQIFEKILRTKVARKNDDHIAEVHNVALRKNQNEIKMLNRQGEEIGRASCRERVCQYV